MKAVLVILGVATFDTKKANVQRVDAQIYVNAEDRDMIEEICDRLITEGGYDTYIIPSMYSGEIEFPPHYDPMPEFETGDWHDVEMNLPNYSRRDDILEHDILTRLVDGEEVDKNDRSDWSDNIPKGLTLDEWFFSQLAEWETEIHKETREEMERLGK